MYHILKYGINPNNFLNVGSGVFDVTGGGVFEGLVIKHHDVVGITLTGVASRNKVSLASRQKVVVGLIWSAVELIGSYVFFLRTVLLAKQFFAHIHFVLFCLAQLVVCLLFASFQVFVEVTDRVRHF